MFVRVRGLAVLLLLAFGFAAPAEAVVPSTMGYQGLLTDGGGNPLSGSHAVAFSIYDVASGGAALWTESHVSVSVTNGQFSVVLGSVTPLTPLMFDRPYWLGISVDGGGELSPRVPLASSPYALSLRIPFVAVDSLPGPLVSLKNFGGASALQADPYLRLTGTADNTGGIMEVFSPDNNRTVQIWGGNGPWGGGAAGLLTVGTGSVISSGISQTYPGNGTTGQVYVRGSTPQRVFVVNGDNSGTGNPRLYLNGAASQFIVDTNLSGDACVSLPASSVGPSEMFGEPGISQNMVPSSAIPIFPATISSIVSTSITTPAPGYVTVDGSAQSMLFGTTSQNNIIFQISQSATGPTEANYARVVGADGWASTSAAYGAMVTTRTYFLSAGTYTFHFIASKQGASGSAFMILPTIRATYFPSSYGTVTAAVSPGQETEFDHVEVVSGGTSPDGRTMGPAMLVDLRDLELRATRARLDAERAERDLRAARVEAEMAAFERHALSARKKSAAETAK